MEDKSRLSIVSTAPEGTSFEVMDEYMLNLIGIVDTLPEKTNFLAITAPGFGSSPSTNAGFVRLILTEPSERERSQQEIADELSAITRRYNFARTFVTQEQTIGGGRGAGLPVQFVILAPSFEKLRAAIPPFMEKAQGSPLFQVTDLNLKFNKPEISLDIDRNRARTLGVNVRDVAENLQLYFSGQRYGYFILNNKQYQEDAAENS
jgi:multidrug efflux pump